MMVTFEITAPCPCGGTHRGISVRTVRVNLRSILTIGVGPGHRGPCDTCDLNNNQPVEPVETTYRLTDQSAAKVAERQQILRARADAKKAARV